MATQKNEEIMKMLEEGVKSIFTSDRYLKYLAFLTKFHNYSFRNSLLIMLQNPEATLVAGFNDWKNKHHRYVKKGEKGLKILAPVPYKIKVEVPVLDDNDNPVVINGKTLTEEKTVDRLSFKVVSVFDISQTDGEPIPQLVSELTTQVKDYSDLFSAISNFTDCPIEFIDIQGSAHGYYSYTTNEIKIDNGMSEAQNIKTLIHEVAHSRLHTIDDDLTRNEKEVQAESIAYIVANHFGIDTSDYSFEYIASWSSNKELTELSASLDIIQKEANAMIKGIEEQYQILLKNKDIELIEDKPEQGVDRDIDGIEDSRDSSYSQTSDIVMRTLQSYPLPDNSITQQEMFDYGYKSQSMLPISLKQALSFYDYTNLPVYNLYSDNTEGQVENRTELLNENSVMYGIEKDEWEKLCREQFIAPHIKIEWSEFSGIKDNQLLTLNEANSLFESCDIAARNFYGVEGGYDKTKFALFYIANNVANIMVDRQDFGDGDGSLIKHIGIYDSSLSEWLQCHSQIDKLAAEPFANIDNLNILRTELNSISIDENATQFILELSKIYDNLNIEVEATKERSQLALDTDLIRQANSATLMDMGDIINRDYLKNLDLVTKLNLTDDVKQEAYKTLKALHNEQLSLQAKAVNPYVSGVAKLTSQQDGKNADRVVDKGTEIKTFISSLQKQSEQNDITDKHNRINAAILEADKNGQKTITVDGVTYYKSRKNWSTKPPKRSQNKATPYDKEENERIINTIKSEISIQDYAQSIGFTVQRAGSYFTLKEHDSVRIDPRKNRFVQNSTGIKGSIIDFVMQFENLDKAAAINKLAKYIGTDVGLSSISVQPSQRSSDISKSLVLPQKAKTMRNIFAYLINTRKIDSQIVSQWVKNGNLYQDTHNNCVFVTYGKDGKPDFVSQRGTNTNVPFKSDVIGSNYDTCHFINNNAHTLVIGEAVIDIMSLQTILKANGRDINKYNYLSTNGTAKTNAVINALQNSQTDTVVLATDNDNAGKKARIALRELISDFDKNIKVIDYVPQNEKDWNAELVTNIEREKINQDKHSEKTSLSEKISECQQKADNQNKMIDNQKIQHRTNQKSEPNIS
jgi:hypothetical protein